MVGNPAHDENIRRRAYEICLERGGQPGRELDDWLKPSASSKCKVRWQASTGISDAGF